MKVMSAIQHYTIGLLSVIFMFYSCTEAKEPAPKTVEHVDLTRYAGTWYEIARFPHRFEKDLVGVTATYNLLNNNKIEVINKGYKYNLNGELKRAVGKAKIPNPERSGHLRVSFFLFFYADYLILELDEENYQYALVGSSSDNYLWILGRTPQMTDDIFNMLVEKARQRGYDVDKLEKVEQPDKTVL